MILEGTGWEESNKRLAGIAAHGDSESEDSRSGEVAVRGKEESPFQCHNGDSPLSIIRTELTEERTSFTFDEVHQGWSPSRMGSIKDGVRQRRCRMS